MPTRRKEFFPKVAKLVNSKEGSTRILRSTVDKSVTALAERFERRKVNGRLFVDLHDDQEAKYTVSIHDGETEVRKEAGESDLKLVTDKRTWIEMATGRLSPGDAFVNGRMEVHGDIRLARRLYALAAKGEIEDINI